MKHVLIIDDSLTVRMDLDQAFTEAGWLTTLCDSGESAAQALAAGRFDVIVLDVLLPDASGIDLLQQYKKDPATARTPVILLSSAAEVADQIRGLSFGADDYVGKPYDRAYLVAQAQRLTGGKAPAASGRSLPSVVVIEDSLTFGEALRESLHQAGYAATLTRTGEEGVKLVARLRPDVAIVDGSLPGIDGPTVVQRIKSDEALRHIPCLMLTASFNTQAEVRSLESGVDAFVRKEEGLAIILARLSAMLRSGASAKAGAAEVESIYGPKKILAVDDSPTYLDALATHLRQDSYDVILARSGQEALDLLAARPVDCILLDLVMPAMAGEEVCRKIKQSPAWRSIPVIMLTGREDREAMLESFGAGADDYVPKSSDFAVLRARLRAQLRRRQFEGENQSIREQLHHKEIEVAEARAARELAEIRAGLLADLRRKNAELEQAHQELRVSEQRFRSIFENAAVGIALNGPDGRWIQVNQQFCDLLGYTRQELLGRAIAELTHPDDRAEDQERFQKLIQGQIGSYALEKRYLHKSGHPVWVSITRAVQREEAGQTPYSISIIQDIGDRKRFEQQLQAINQTLEQRIAERTAELQERAGQLRRLASELTQAEQRERQRLARLLHDELQQLLVGAKFNVGILRGTLGEDEYRQPLQQVDELLDQSLETSRSLTAELSPPILQEGSFAQVLHWLARWARDKYGLEVQVQADERVNPHVQQVRVLLFQAVRELLLNIAKHAGVRKARVTMRRQETGPVEITVKDEGTGFDVANRQAEQSQHQTGSGFGLFSIRERLELLDGQMMIESSPGQGTCVTLLAPCCPAEDPSVAATAAREQELEGAIAEIARRTGPSNGVIRVLLADDHAVVRDGLSRLLQTKEDIEVVGLVSDGQQAVDMALQLQPDVVLMDVSMPELDGVEATRRIIQRLPDIKIIGLSMHVQEDVAASMSAAGAVAYVTKTSPPEALVARIRECARSKKE